MKGAIQVLLTAICFGGFGGGARAQLSDSDGSAQWVAGRIASDGGGSAADYLDYAHRLAKTMSQYPASVQEKIFGFMPPVSGKPEDSEDSRGNRNNGGDQGGNAMMSPAAALANPDLSSGEVFDALLSQSPLSEADVLGMLERAFGEPAAAANPPVHYVILASKLGGVFNMGGVAVANYVSILERSR